MRKISLDKLNQLFAEIASKNSLYIPVDTAAGAKYEKYDGTQTMSEALNTTRSAKDFFFPQTENLVDFKIEGKNIEIKEAVGDDNIIIFGMNADEVVAKKQEGYNPKSYYDSNETIKQAVNRIYKGINGCAFNEIANSLQNSDPYMVLADFDSYRAAQKRSSELYNDKYTWLRMSLQNIAGAGIFSADRAVNDYARDIWGIR